MVRSFFLAEWRHAHASHYQSCCIIRSVSNIDLLFLRNRNYNTQLCSVIYTSKSKLVEAFGFVFTEQTLQYTALFRNLHIKKQVSRGIRLCFYGTGAIYGEKFRNCVAYRRQSRRILLLFYGTNITICNTVP